MTDARHIQEISAPAKEQVGASAALHSDSYYGASTHGNTPPPESPTVRTLPQFEVTGILRAGPFKDSPTTVVGVGLHSRDGSDITVVKDTPNPIKDPNLVYTSVNTRRPDGTLVEVDMDPRTGRPSVVTTETGDPDTLQRDPKTNQWTEKTSRSVVDLDPRTGKPTAVTLESANGVNQHFRIDPATGRAVPDPQAGHVQPPLR